MSTIPVSVKIQKEMMIFTGTGYRGQRYEAIANMIETRILHRAYINLLKANRHVLHHYISTK